MEKYAHFKTYELRYSDFDFKDRLKLSALLELLQESACLSANELGFGYDDLRPRGLGFITADTCVEFVRPIVLGDTLTVETWPLPPRHVVFDRAYRVTDREGTPVALGMSRWCLVDLKTFAMLPPETLGEAHAKCPYRAEKTVEERGRNFRLDGEAVRSYRVGSSQCDHYRHANNTRYADFFMDCFSSGELAPRDIKSFRISYVKQAKEGEELLFYRRDEGNETRLEASENGETVSRMRIVFSEKT